MIYVETELGVTDNSGARIAKCIRILKSGRSSKAKVASLLIISIKKIKYNKNIIKGQLCKGILVRAKKNIQRETGLSIKFVDNSLVIVDQKNLPIASRISGPIYKELRLKDYPKVLALARNVL
jgi:large subunit ribosomal protein L14